jgi:hypothetical protein
LLEYFLILFANCYIIIFFFNVNTPSVILCFV